MPLSSRGVALAPHGSVLLDIIRVEVAPPSAQPHLRPAPTSCVGRLDGISSPAAAERTTRRKAGAVRQRSFYIVSGGVEDDDEELERAASTARTSLDDSAPGSRRGSQDVRRTGQDVRHSSGQHDAPAQPLSAAAAAHPSPLQQQQAQPQQQPQQQLLDESGDAIISDADADAGAADADADPSHQSADLPEVVEYVLDDSPMMVKPGLYIGSMLAERDKRKLRGTNITDILQVAEGLYPNHPLNFNYMNLQVQDCPAEDLVVHFPRCFSFIDAAIARNGNVLVHCAGGVSRSATVVLGYLMARHGMSFEEALAHLRGVRPWVNPNSGFSAQLREFERLGLDVARWNSWGHVWQELWQQQQQLAGGEGGGGGVGAPGAGYLEGYRQCIISIPPPAGEGLSGGGGGSSSGGGQLAAELMGFARLRVDGEGATGGRPRAQPQTQ